MRKNLQHLIIAALALLAISCGKENMHKQIDQEDLVSKVTEILNGDIIVRQHVKMSNVSKTLLPEGCPTKLRFTWDAQKNAMQIYLDKIKPGTMPFPISMTSSAQLLELNSWEKNEYPGGGWIKIFDDKAEVTAYQEDYPDPLPNPDGSAIVKGYFNTNTLEIELIINYNVMNVTGHIYKQKVDKTRTNFEEELSDFEEGLCAYKLDHGVTELRKEITQQALDILSGSHTFTANTTLNGKQAEKNDLLPITFTWDGSPITNAAGRMAIQLPKTTVNGNTLQLSLEGKGRWLDVLTWAEEKQYGNSNSEWIKLKATGIKTTLWNAAGSTQTTTSDKGEMRIIINVKTKQAALKFKNSELKLNIAAPLKPVK